MNNPATTKIINRILTIVGVIFLLLLLVTCDGVRWKHHLIKQLGGYTQQDIKVTIDTVSVRYDSIRASKVELILDSIGDPETIVEYRTKWLKPDKDKNGNFTGTKTPTDTVYSKVLRFNTPFSDTLIAGNIRTIFDTNSQKIIQQGLEYELLKPYLVTKTITIEKIIEKTLTNEDKAKIGIGVLGQSDLSYGGALIYQTKKIGDFQAAYIRRKLDIPETRNENIVQIGIIKLF